MSDRIKNLLDNITKAEEEPKEPSIFTQQPNGILIAFEKGEKGIKFEDIPIGGCVGCKWPWPTTYVSFGVMRQHEIHMNGATWPESACMVERSVTKCQWVYFPTIWPENKSNSQQT